MTTITLYYHNLTHRFYVNFIHVLFAKSYGCPSNNLLDALLIIKWYLFVNSSVSWHITLLPWLLVFTQVIFGNPSFLLVDAI